MPAKRVRDGKGKNAYLRQRAALRRRVARDGLTCWLCGEPFDLTLSDKSAMGFSADHVEALNNGGHLVRNELRPAHLGCNARRGDRPDVEIWEAT